MASGACVIDVLLRAARHGLGGLSRPGIKIARDEETVPPPAHTSEVDLDFFRGEPGNGQLAKHVPMQGDISGSPAKSVHGNLVNGSGDGLKINSAARRPDDLRVNMIRGD